MIFQRRKKLIDESQQTQVPTGTTGFLWNIVKGRVLMRGEELNIGHGDKANLQTVVCVTVLFPQYAYLSKLKVFSAEYATFGRQWFLRNCKNAWKNLYLIQQNRPFFLANGNYQGDAHCVVSIEFCSDTWRVQGYHWWAVLNYSEMTLGEDLLGALYESHLTTHFTGLFTFLAL